MGKFKITLHKQNEMKKRIGQLKAEGKFGEAEYLEKDKDKIETLWQINHLWVFLWKKHKLVFIVFILLILVITILVV